MLTNLKKTLYNKWQIFLCFLAISSLIFHYYWQFLHHQNENFFLYLTIIIGGSVFIIQIFLKILKGILGADLIALIALILAIYLQENVTAVLIILMLASGQALEEFASHKASFVLEALNKRMPSIAHRKIDNNFVDINVDQININDLIALFPHEICPVDGEIIQGLGSMDESYLTGEPYRIEKTVGSKVLSGAINGESLFIIRAEKISSDSRYGKIMEIMKKAQIQKPQIHKLADKIGAVFAPIALLIAGISYYFSGNLLNFLAVLTIATPCPLIIAVPIAIISAISISARQGIVIKDPRILENLSICTTAIFDKTGTLTYGEPSVDQIIALDQYSSTDILQKCASLERYSRHPLAFAILKEAQQKHVILLNADNIAEKAGYGMVGFINNDEIIITNRNKIHEFIQPAQEIPQHLSGLECVVVINRKIAGIIVFRDLERKESHSFISHLAPNHNFNKIILLSGDRESEVAYLAKRLGISKVFSSQSPESKLELIKSETKLAPTLFIGDGINDAPALMMSTVGIAFGQGNNITSESAQAVILESNLLKVDELFHICQITRQIILQSALGGMIFSIIGMICAGMGMISPSQGAVLQQIIDFIAIINALRLTLIKNIKSDIEH